jgi:hypothetical protein
MPSTGISVMVENRDLLGIPLEVPDFPSSRTRKPRVRDPSASEGRSHDPNGSKNNNNRQGLPQGNLGLPETIARGLLDKGESLGINKALMNAVSDLKVGFLSLILLNLLNLGPEKFTGPRIVLGPYTLNLPSLLYRVYSPSSCG